MDDTSHPVGGVRGCETTLLGLEKFIRQAQARSNTCIAPSQINPRHLPISTRNIYQMTAKVTPVQFKWLHKLKTG